MGMAAAPPCAWLSLCSSRCAHQIGCPADLSNQHVTCGFDSHHPLGVRRLLNQLERVMGIEPTLRAWEAPVLPLNYTRLGPLPASGILTLNLKPGHL